MLLDHAAMVSLILGLVWVSMRSSQSTKLLTNGRSQQVLKVRSFNTRKPPRCIQAPASDSVGNMNTHGHLSTSGTCSDHGSDKEDEQRALIIRFIRGAEGMNEHLAAPAVWDCEELQEARQI
jgi:hypothetical protein